MSSREHRLFSTSVLDRRTYATGKVVDDAAGHGIRWAENPGKPDNLPSSVVAHRLMTVHLKQTTDNQYTFINDDLSYSSEVSDRTPPTLIAHPSTDAAPTERSGKKSQWPRLSGVF